MTNAFVAALLKVAAEERAAEESLQNQAEASDERFGWWDIADHLRASASEHAGRAEVYERFANRIIGDIAGELLLKQVEKEFPPLSGSAEIPVEFQLDNVPKPWLLDYYRYYVPLPQQPLIITQTN